MMKNVNLLLLVGLLSGLGSLSSNLLGGGSLHKKCFKRVEHSAGHIQSP